MFSGIIETMGKVEGCERRAESMHLSVHAPQIAAGVKDGDSVAVNGVCLTVIQAENGRVHFDVVQESLDRSALDQLQSDMQVNLERALAADARFDGHIVQGHVDGVGEVAAFERQGEDVRLRVRCHGEFAGLLVPKGSVAINGVSLTVVGVGEDIFDVALIPFTLEHTTLGQCKPGMKLNLEADVLGKYMKKYLEQMLPAFLNQEESHESST